MGDTNKPSTFYLVWAEEEHHATPPTYSPTHLPLRTYLSSHGLELWREWVVHRDCRDSSSVGAISAPAAHPLLAAALRPGGELGRMGMVTKEPSHELDSRLILPSWGSQSLELCCRV